MNFQKIFNPQEIKRYYTGVGLILLLAVILYYHNPILIWATLGVFYLVAFHESLRLFSLKPSPFAYLSAVLIWIVAFFSSNPVQSGLMGAAFVAGILAYKTSFSPKYLFPLLYPTLPFLVLFSLYTQMGTMGIFCLLWLIITVAITDTTAYFGGKLIGHTPLSPTSPNKTLEGVGSGLFCGICFGLWLGIGPSGGFISSLVITAFVAITSIMGDLFESYLKRMAGVKDSGNLLPGHGGVLDRFDGILFGGIAMYCLLSLLFPFS
ncbi:hypothetical protein BBW65_07485 [Helicobacter enhydrae]|uniref:Phosphatidate cytidylyltransferase n=1 Tax=Helicobacter enhydrae TaxID=222136 RepID=A0A1B1U7A0_9HELI|nr:phosphatidate cytidylyltransferase [Helicobacter enhydrae]ANV98649.1 hypothetical protein BBW65_07485 [Helicobacter enhydrae]